MPRRPLFLLALCVLTGCTSKTTRTVEPAIDQPRPFLDISRPAREVLRQIAVDQKLGPEWWVRLEVVWKPDARIEVNLDRKLPGPDDFAVEADGLRCVMPADQKVYLKGARVELAWAQDGAGFDVSFPNRDANDRQAAAAWLKSENERRKAAK